MKTMKMNILILLLICSCKTLDPVERCTVSFQFQKCICKMFDVNKWESVGEPYSKEITYCDDLTGFKPASWAKEFRPYYNYIKDWSSEHCDSTWKTVFKENKPIDNDDDDWHDI